MYMEKAMAPHSSTLAWKIPWTEEPGRLQSMGSLRVRHDWATPFPFSLSSIGKGNGNPLQCSCLENPREGGAWWTAVYGVALSRTRLKWLSSSLSSSSCLCIALIPFRVTFHFTFTWARFSGDKTEGGGAGPVGGWERVRNEMYYIKAHS